MDNIIYTYGYGKIIYDVLNSLSIFLKSNAYINTVGAFAFMLGTSIAYVQYSVQNNSLGLFTRKWILPTALYSALMIIPKTTVHIVDKVNPTMQAVSVANVPLGVATLFSGISTFFHAISSMVEDSFTKNSDSNKTGMFFGSKLLSSTKDVFLHDPKNRANVLHFAHNCFYEPYILANAEGAMEEALKTEDILGFVKQHSHKLSGVNWQEAGGKVKFFSCKDAVVKVEAVLKTEAPKSLKSLVMGVFGAPRNAHLNGEILGAMGDVYQRYAKHTGNANKAVQQQMLINATRVAKDNHREALKLSRHHPELISMASTRTRSEQETGWLLKHDIAGFWLPMLQGALIAFLIIAFIIIIPLCLLPGGFSVFGLWVRLIVWVNSWSFFTVILNIVAEYFLDLATGAGFSTFGPGFSYLSSSSIHESAYNIFCWLSGMQLAISALSWAIISKSGYAISNYISGITGGIDSSAAKFASEVTDNNLQFGNHSMGNENYHNKSIAQQHLGASVNMATNVNDGGFNTTHTLDGDVLTTEGRSNLKHNLSGTDVIGTSLQKSIGENATKQKTATDLYNENFAKTITASDALTNNLAHVDGKTVGLTKTEQIEFNKSLDEQGKAAQSLSDNHGIGTDTTAQWSLNIGGMIKAAGAHIPGVRVMTDAIGSLVPILQSQGYNKKAISKITNSDEFKAFAESSRKVHSIAQKVDYTNADSDTIAKAKNYQDSYAKTENLSKQVQNLESEGVTLAELSAINTNQGITLQEDLTDKFIQYVADKKYNGNKDAAKRIIGRNDLEGRSTYNTLLHNFQDEYAAKMIAPVRQKIKEGRDKQFIGVGGNHLKENVTKNINKEKETLTGLSEKIVPTGQIQGEQKALEKEYQNKNKNFDQELKDRKNLVNATQSQLQKKHNKQNDQSNLSRVGQKVWSNTFGNQKDNFSINPGLGNDIKHPPSPINLGGSNSNIDKFNVGNIVGSNNNSSNLAIPANQKNITAQIILDSENSKKSSEAVQATRPIVRETPVVPKVTKK